jgi:hypothetical protein
MRSILTVPLLFLTVCAFSQSRSEGEYHVDKDYKMAATGTLRLNCSDAKVYITGSARSNAHVKIDRIVSTKGLTFGHEEFNIDISEESGDLEIRERSNSVSIGVVGYHYEKYTINIDLPQGASLKVKGDDGDYWVKNVDGAISLDVDDADVELAQCSGNKFYFRIDDGDIKMDEGKGSLEIDGDDSDIQIKNANFDFVDAKIDDGDLIIETSLADKGEYRIDAQDGMIAFTVTQGGGKFDIRHDDGRITTEGNFTTEADDDNWTRVTAPNGTARVDIRADDARVKLIKR